VRDLFAREGRAALHRLARRRALVAFDFDGTLAPIVRHHSAARMRPRTRALLAEVARLYPCAIVSGRARADLRLRLPDVPVRWLVGNHGAESGSAAGATAALRRSVRRWALALGSRLRGVPGVEVEAKRLSVSVHYRASRRPAEARTAILEAARRIEGARIQEGKRVVNLLGRDAPDKGDALAALVRRTGADAVLFAGDDVTDEDVFGRDLGAWAVTIRVGRLRRSSADYSVAGQGAIDRLLEALVSLRGERGTGGTAPPASAGDDPLSILNELWALVHALETSSKRMHRNLGVTGPQRLLVRTIGSRPGCSPGEAARHLRAHPGSVTRLVAGLESLGLVSRKDDPRDRRVVRLELTERGRRVADLRRGTIEEVIRIAMAGATPRGTAEALAFLRRITAALAASPRPGRPGSAGGGAALTSPA
jgi:trehalose 6-phosphate phosphatase